MRSNLASLYPSVYRGILEIDILTEIGDKQFNDWFDAAFQARLNQFVQTADSYGLSYLERLYEIRFTPDEDLEFRRKRLLIRMNTQPPFTIRFLRDRLDEIIGVDKYKTWVGYSKYNYLLGSWQLGEQPFQEDPYHLYIETAASNSAWAHEVDVLIGKIKPAHIVYHYIPMLASAVAIGEEIVVPKVVWNYRLNGGWRLGEKAFYSDTEEKVVKMTGTSSIKQGMLSEHAVFTSTQVAKALLNDVVEITDLQISTVGAVTTIRYEVPESIGEITNIKLLKADGEIWTESALFVAPSGEQRTVKHYINHKEGM